MSVYFKSMKGKRSQNEDAHKIILNANGLDNTFQNVNYYAIFDGHGGKQISNFVNDNIYKFFVDKKVKYPLTTQYINKVFDTVQNNIIQNNNGVHVGTTALIAVNYRNEGVNYLNIMNSGDCRAVLCRDNLAMPLTKDHKPEWPEETVRITNLGGKIYFDDPVYRIKDLSVSRAFGDIDATPYVTHKPDIFRWKIEKNDKFFILACDGVWDVLSNQDVVNFVLNIAYEPDMITRKKNTFNVAHKIAQLALNKGSTDNITVILVFL